MDKGCAYFDLKLVHVALGSDFRVLVPAVEAAITPNTILIIGSAPQVEDCREPTISRPQARFWSRENHVFWSFQCKFEKPGPCTGSSKKLGPPSYKTVPGEDLWSALSLCESCAPQVEDFIV